MMAPDTVTAPTRWRRAGSIASDLILATAVIWALPLLIGVLGALGRLVSGLF